MNENYDDERDDLTVDQPDDSRLAKDLRKQLRQARKELVQRDTVSPEVRAAFEAVQRAETGAETVPQLGEAAFLKLVADNKGKGSDAMIAALQARGLVSG